MASDKLVSGVRRSVELDFLRGIAILLVIFYHSTLHNTALGALAPVLDPIISFGWTGVNLFFVLSGFLVGGLLFKEIRATGKVDVWRFLVRRAFKIWPAYFIFIGYYYLKLVHRKDGVRGAFVELWPNLLHIQNYIRTPPHHTWSLAVEEHFYLTFALAVFLLMRGGKSAVSRLRIFIWTAPVFLILCLVLRALNWDKPFDNFTHMWPTHLCVDALFLGVCLGYIYHFQPQVFERVASHRVWLLVFSAVAVAPMIFVPKTSPFTFTIGVTLLSLGFGALLIAVVPPPSGAAAPARFWNLRIVKLVAWVGVYSYSIYLWHLDLVAMPLFSVLGPMWKYQPVTQTAFLYLCLLVIGSVAIGVLMAKLIEFPALRLRERLMPPRRPTAPREAPPEAVIPAEGTALPGFDTLS